MDRFRRSGENTGDAGGSARKLWGPILYVVELSAFFHQLFD